MALRKYEDVSNEKLIQYLYAFRLDKIFDTYDWIDLVEEIELRLKLKEITIPSEVRKKMPHMQINKRPQKDIIADELIELLEIPNNDIAEMKISFLRMKKPALNLLMQSIKNLIKREELKCQEFIM